MAVCCAHNNNNSKTKQNKTKPKKMKSTVCSYQALKTLICIKITQCFTATGHVSALSRTFWWIYECCGGTTSCISQICFQSREASFLSVHWLIYKEVYRQSYRRAATATGTQTQNPCIKRPSVCVSVEPTGKHISQTH